MRKRDRKLSSTNLERTGYTFSRVDLYRQAASELRTRDSGLARYVIEIFGPDLIGSLAFAIDPFKQFVNLSNNVALLSEGAPVVRTRKRVGIESSQRKLLYETSVVVQSYQRNPQKGLFDYMYTGPTRTVSSGSTNRTSQPKVYAWSKDTTARTRPKGKNQGEFEIFVPSLRSPDRSYGYHKIDRIVYNAIGTGQLIKSNTYVYSKSIGPEFRIEDAAVQAYLPVIRARALAEMQKNVLGMLDQVQPSHRTFDLVRQIAELRELPQTLRGSLEVWQSFERLVGTNLFRTLQQSTSSWLNPILLRDYSRILGRNTGFRFDELATLDQNAGSAYLTFKFGWESTLRGIFDFLPSPHMVARQINRLINRIGRDTSFRTRRTWTEDETSTPEISFSLLRDEVLARQVRIAGKRKTELRLVANFNIQFPQADIPRLRRELYLRKLGAYPSASDVYNLIPWTWLGDWFLGAGDYLELIESIANDRSLINYGFITYRQESDLDLTASGRFTTEVTRLINGVSNNSSRSVVIAHTGKLKLVYQLRRSIPSLTNVKSIWGSNLNSHQSAIIGALLSTRSGSRARRDAS